MKILLAPRSWLSKDDAVPDRSRHQSCRLLVTPVHEHGKRQQAASGHQYDQPEDEKPLRKPSQRFHNDPFTCRRSSELTSRFDMPDDEAAGLGCRSQTTHAL